VLPVEGRRLFGLVHSNKNGRYEKTAESLAALRLKENEVIFLLIRPIPFY